MAYEINRVVLTRQALSIKHADTWLREPQKAKEQVKWTGQGYIVHSSTTTKKLDSNTHNTIQKAKQRKRTTFENKQICKNSQYIKSKKENYTKIVDIEA